MTFERWRPGPRAPPGWSIPWASPSHATPPGVTSSPSIPFRPGSIPGTLEFWHVNSASKIVCVVTWWLENSEIFQRLYLDPTLLLWRQLGLRHNPTSRSPDLQKEKHVTRGETILEKWWNLKELTQIESEWWSLKKYLHQWIFSYLHLSQLHTDTSWYIIDISSHLFSSSTEQFPHATLQARPAGQSLKEFEIDLHIYQ